MKHTRMILTALMAAALALAVLAGCSSVLAGTVHEDTEQAAALMKEIDTGLAYSTELEAAASRLAEWLVEEPGQLGTQSGQLARKVELTADSGNMTDTNLNDFIDHSSISSNIWVNIPSSVTIGLVLDNQSRAFTGYLYAPAAGQAPEPEPLRGRPQPDGRCVHPVRRRDLCGGAVCVKNKSCFPCRNHGPRQGFFVLCMRTEKTAEGCFVHGKHK